MSGWIIFALLGAVFWGLHYPLLEKGLSFINPLTIMFIIGSFLVLSIGVFYKDLYAELTKLAALDTKNQLIILAIVITEFIAIYCVTRAISEGNATYVSLIEISYPVFVIIFSYILFKVNHFNVPIVVGSILIFVGSGLIVFNEKSEDKNSKESEIATQVETEKSN